MKRMIDEPCEVQVRTGARLHFGLLHVGKAERQFGGLGAMIDRPGYVLTARRAQAWSCDGPEADRILSLAKLARAGVAADLKAAFSLEAVIPAHAGLGSGTQLALAVSAALYALSGAPLPSPRQMAIESLRGRRSAIGCHGFYQGGLLFDGGKKEGEPLAELQCRVDLPPDWRFVLIRPPKIAGLAGAGEERVFEEAPSVNDGLSSEMAKLARESIIPAAFEADFSRFSKALYEYGWRAGAAFAFAQGDIFSHPDTRKRVEDLRHRGIEGVGQSSWGPTIFALLESEPSAQKLVSEIENAELYRDCEIWTTKALNHGAEVGVPPLGGRSCELSPL